MPGECQLCENGAARPGLSAAATYSTLPPSYSAVHPCSIVQSCAVPLCNCAEKKCSVFYNTVSCCVPGACSAVQTVQGVLHAGHTGSPNSSRPALYRAGARRGLKGVQNNKLNLSALCSADAHNTENKLLLNIISKLG